MGQPRRPLAGADRADGAVVVLTERPDLVDADLQTGMRFVEQVVAGDVLLVARTRAPDAGPTWRPARTGCRRGRRRRTRRPPRRRAKSFERVVGAATRETPVGEGRPQRRAVPADRRAEPRRHARLPRWCRDVLAPGILVHVEHDVEIVPRGPADRLPYACDVPGVEGAALGLERRPAHHEPHHVEAETRRLALEVALTQRQHRRQRGVGGVVVAELVDVDAAQQDLPAASVDDRGIVSAVDLESRKCLRGRRPARAPERAESDDAQSLALRLDTVAERVTPADGDRRAWAQTRQAPAARLGPHHEPDTADAGVRHRRARGRRRGRAGPSCAHDGVGRQRDGRVANRRLAPGVYCWTVCAAPRST